MHALELLLDEATDDAVRRDWAALRAAGLPSQADHTGASNAPHITLVTTEESPPPDVDLSAALGGHLPLTVRLGPLVTFPGRRIVLARIVVLDVALLALHAAAVRALAAPVSPITLPGAWVPHVTLARGLRTQELGPAVEAVSTGVLSTRVERVRRWDSVARQTHDLVG